MAEGKMREGCSFCGSEGIVIWHQGQYRALKCKGCGVIWISPKPDAGEARNIYSADYFQKWYLKYERERKEYFSQRLAEIEELSGSTGQGRRLLDIGCGVGLFLEIAREKGWDGEGVEISEFASEYVRGKGLKVHIGDLGSLDLAPASFDLVTMWDVLAHVRDPGRYLKRINELLKEKGVLVIKTPDHPARLFGLAALGSLFGPSRGVLHVPAQVYHFEPCVLKGILERVGFKVIWIKKTGEAIKGGWTSSLFKNMLIRSFNALARIAGIGESFIMCARKVPCSGVQGNR